MMHIKTTLLLAHEHRYASSIALPRIAWEPWGGGRIGGGRVELLITRLGPLLPNRIDGPACRRCQMGLLWERATSLTRTRE